MCSILSNNTSRRDSRTSNRCTTSKKPVSLIPNNPDPRERTSSQPNLHEPAPCLEICGTQRGSKVRNPYPVSLPGNDHCTRDHPEEKRSTDSDFRRNCGFHTGIHVFGNRRLSGRSMADGCFPERHGDQ